MLEHIESLAVEDRAVDHILDTLRWSAPETPAERDAVPWRSREAEYSTDRRVAA